MIDIQYGSHMAFFPAKVASAMGTYGHVYNIVLSANTDNGVLAGRGAYSHFDNYAQAAAPNGFAGKIIDTAPNGNYYVEVTELGDGETLVLYNAPTSEYAERDLQQESLFYNKTGDVVQGMPLKVGDWLELSKEAFVGTPVLNKAGTFSAGKYNVAS